MVVGCQFSCQWSVVGCQWARRVDESIHFGERVYRDWKNVRRRGLSVASSVVSGQLSVVSKARSVDESRHFGERVYRDWKNVRRRGLSVASSVVSGQLSVVSGLEGSMKVGISVRERLPFTVVSAFGGNGSRRGRAMEDLPITHQSLKNKARHPAPPITHQSLKQSASRQPSHRLLTPTNN
jgi:hypothetical protein